MGAPRRFRLGRPDDPGPSSRRARAATAALRGAAGVRRAASTSAKHSTWRSRRPGPTVCAGSRSFRESQASARPAWRPRSHVTRTGAVRSCSTGAATRTAPSRTSRGWTHSRTCARTRPSTCSASTSRCVGASRAPPPRTGGESGSVRPPRHRSRDGAVPAVRLRRRSPRPRGGLGATGSGARRPSLGRPGIVDAAEVLRRARSARPDRSWWRSTATAICRPVRHSPTPWPRSTANPASSSSRWTAWVGTSSWRCSRRTPATSSRTTGGCCATCSWPRPTAIHSSRPRPSDTSRRQVRSVATRRAAGRQPVICARSACR